MRISIIVPVYNKEKYLDVAIGSALGQSFDDLEVIAIDDGSTDGSLDALKRIAAKYPKLVVHSQRNQGLSGARNAGIEIATGDYIGFHDADDILEQDAMARLLEAARVHNADIAGGVFRRHVGNSSFIVDAFAHDDYSMNFRNDKAKAERYCTNFSSCNKIFRAELFRNPDFRFTQGLYMQDIEFWLKAMFSCSKVTQVQHVVSNYRFFNDSGSRLRSKARFDSLFALFEGLETHFGMDDYQPFRVFGHYAIMQGALPFFAKWKLEHWKLSGDQADLDRMRELLLKIPESNIASFCRMKRSISNAHALLLIRDGNYRDACRIGELATAPAMNSPLIQRAIREPAVARKFYQYYFNSAIFERSLRLAARLEWVSISPRQALRVVYGKAKAKVFPHYRVIKRHARSMMPTMQRRWGKKILVFGLGDIYSIGGVQLSYQRLFSHLLECGHSVSFYTHHEKPANPGQYYPLSAKVSVCHHVLSDSAEGLREIRAIAAAEDPDVVLVVYSGQWALTIGAALYDTRYPVVFSERGGADHCLEHNWHNQTQRELAHFASDHAHVLMPEYRKAAPKKLSHWIDVIPSVTEKAAVTARPGHPRSDGRFSVLYTGRLSFEKDLNILISAFSKLAEEFENWDLEIMGDGPERNSLAAQANRLGLSSRVNFRGNLANIQSVFEAYTHSHLFVLPSRAEGCPLSLREAMAHGLPVIGFASCSGTNEIIVEDRNGLLAGSTDKAGELATAMSRLMRDGALRCRLGEAGVKDVEKYAPDIIHGQWEELLVKVSKWKGNRSELRKLKRGVSSSDFDQLEQLLRSCVDQGVTRDVATYSGQVREGLASSILMGDYLLLFGAYLFDRNYYLKSNFKLKLKNIDPLEHYLQTGWHSGLRPSPIFDTDYYVRTAMSGHMNECPLVHYYRIGRYAGAAIAADVSETIDTVLSQECLSDGDISFDVDGLMPEAVKCLVNNQLRWKRLLFKKVRRCCKVSIAA